MKNHMKTLHFTPNNTTKNTSLWPLGSSVVTPLDERLPCRIHLCFLSRSFFRSLLSPFSLTPGGACKGLEPSPGHRGERRRRSMNTNLCQAWSAILGLQLSLIDLPWHWHSDLNQYQCSCLNRTNPTNGGNEYKPIRGRVGRVMLFLSWKMQTGLPHFGSCTVTLDLLLWSSQKKLCKLMVKWRIIHNPPLFCSSWWCTSLCGCAAIGHYHSQVPPITIVC